MKIVKTRFFWLLLGLLFGSFSIGAEQPKNVILFLVDDLGWMDLSCQGSKFYKTPNIDKLASSGVRFTDAYSACVVCSPTRAALLTGKYPARLMLTQWLPDGRWNPKGHKMRTGRFLRSLPLEERTLAENLREEGYATFHAGKWHLGGAPFSLPEHHGFDQNLGGDDHGAPGSFFHPFKGTWGIPTTKLRASKQAFAGGANGDYLTDVLAEGTIQLIKENGKKKPFFLYFPFYAVHTPLQGKKEKIERYKQVPKEKRQGNPVYAAMVESVDDAVGKVMGAVRELGMEKDTLVLFTSDNGGFARATDHAPLRANKGSPYEGGIRVPLIITGAGVERKGATCEVPATSSDLYPTILEMAGLPMRPHQHLDGRSLAGALKAKGALEEKPIFWHYPHYNQHPQSAPHSVIRSGSWKLMEFLETGKIELYDLAEDLGESKNLSQAKPELTKELLARLHAWKKEVRAEPMLPNPLVQGSKEKN